MTARAALGLAAAASAAACASFEDPAIVLDLRILSIEAAPPEQLVPFDPARPPDTLPDLEELGLVDAEVCAVIADPGAARRLAWSMTLCAPQDDLRCDPARIYVELGGGVIDDPERAPAAQRACGVLPADPALLLVLEDAVSLDALAGFGGIDVVVAIQVWGEGEDPAGAIHGAKRVRYSPQLPAERTPNRNPEVARIDVAVEGGRAFALPLGRCADQPSPLRIVAGEELPLVPVEADDAREDYLVPTFDGQVRMFTETLTYQWLATHGSWSRHTSGGRRDLTGTLPPTDSEWRTPRAVAEPTDVSLWLIQRDERGGVSSHESCVRVVPR